MPELPHGWRMRNSEGEVAGPPVEEDGAYFSGSDRDSEIGEGALDIRPDSEGWDDVEDDTEDVSVKCLFSEESFGSVKAMIEHCKEKYDFDFAKIQKDHDLDFYSSIKLVNYIRSEVAAGNTKPDVTDKALWADERYMQPALEDDALLFNLDEIDERPVPEDDAAKEGASSKTE